MKDMIRLQVFLSRNGVCSRREAMDVVKSGAVTVNGQPVCEPSFQVQPGHDRVCCHGRPVAAQRYVYVMMHKPCGYVTTKSDSFAKKTVMDLLPAELRHLNPVGRLDKDTEGLLLFTNDGDFLHHFTHPSYVMNKVYAVRVKGELDPDALQNLEQGIVLDGKKTSPAQVRVMKSDGKTTDFQITIHEGWNRQIRRMCAAVGASVRHLKRIQHGPMKLGAIEKGRWRFLTPREISALKDIKQT